MLQGPIAGLLRGKALPFLGTPGWRFRLPLPDHDRIKGLLRKGVKLTVNYEGAPWNGTETPEGNALQVNLGARAVIFRIGQKTEAGPALECIERVSGRPLTLVSEAVDFGVV